MKGWVNRESLESADAVVAMQRLVGSRINKYFDRLTLRCDVGKKE